MTKTILHTTTLLTGIAASALLLQGCKTYTPGSGSGSLLGGSRPNQQPVEPPPATIKPAPVYVKPAVGDTVKPTTVVASASDVGKPGTYPDTIATAHAPIVRDDNGLVVRTSRPHTPLPPPAPIVKNAAPAQSVKPAQAAGAADGAYATYVVKKGDTVGEIANAHGMKSADFIKLNNITNPNKVVVGQKFKVPANAKPLASGPAAPAASAAPADGYNYYTVASGDALSLIAQKHGLKTKELADMNNIQSDATIRVGQKLRVSKKTANGAAAPAAAVAPVPAVPPAAVPRGTTAPVRPAVPAPQPANDAIGGDDVDASPVFSLFDLTSAAPVAAPAQNTLGDAKTTANNAAATAKAGAASATTTAKTAATTVAATAKTTAANVSTTVKEAGSPKTYTTQAPGEDVFFITAKFGSIAIRDLLAANPGISTDPLPVGTVVKLPAPPAAQ